MTGERPCRVKAECFRKAGGLAQPGQAEGRSAIRRPCHAKIAGFKEWNPIMDVEHINAIGNSLADLTKRTVDLRGYL
jgi:hypothetical protein